MREAIECGSGEPLADEHLGSLLDRQVRGHDRTLPYVDSAQKIKKQLAARSRRGTESSARGFRLLL